ncbi:prolyl oligopeptidase family serine peptidase [Pelagibacterium sp. 26DY04]|uniref:alpha/beta hydrolase n=1 Tax=Pelagibacterium sp. 26DY04 TaxID=2967130 RepID=UPI002815277D|nr:prolyl oligopeptidase family serine peptidase [Pelagibacterium sp. 26DY04]WMT86695.1 prolyl oligopeptidase family serine peptidase [Pelagibacterium sp. 26DY04]
MTTPVKLSGPMLPPASGHAKSAVVLLHGYGSDGRDLISLGQFWRDSFPDTLFVAPNAPEVCGGNPFGYQWFPLDLERDRDLSRLVGAETAAPVVTSFLNDLWAQTGLTPGQTILGGFSQGAMMALYAGLRLPESLLGIVSCSGLVVAPEKLGNEIASRPPVLLIHGDIDDVVPVMGSEVALPILLDLGIEAKLHISQGTGHSIAQDGLDAATAFLRERLGI